MLRKRSRSQTPCFCERLYIKLGKVFTPHCWEENKRERRQYPIHYAARSRSAENGCDCCHTNVTRFRFFARWTCTGTIVPWVVIVLYCIILARRGWQAAHICHERKQVRMARRQHPFVYNCRLSTTSSRTDLLTKRRAATKNSHKLMGPPA